MLISGILDRDVIKDYPELCDSALDIELQMYVRHYKRPCLAEHLKVFREMEPNVRCMFSVVEKLLKLLLISPASSCDAERSFSALRRLKTWLRSTMTHVRLNHVVVCHVHQDILSELSCQKIAKEFVILILVMPSKSQIPFPKEVELTCSQQPHISCF